MEQATARVLGAIWSRDRITIFGDYDCDGVVGAHILRSVLSALGAPARTFLPHRDEGYGLSSPTVHRFSCSGTDLLITVDIEVEFKESIAPALGMSYGGRIAILPGQAAAEEFSTLVHELSHEMPHKAERRTATTKTVRETEAEAIAFVVPQTIGLDAGHSSADYIHLYQGNAALLAESLEVIQRTSALILSAIQTPAATAEQTEAEADPEPALAQAS
jgi:hypothetical protein